MSKEEKAVMWLEFAMECWSDEDLHFCVEQAQHALDHVEKGVKYV